MARQTFHVEGLKELGEALSELSKATGKNVLRRVLMKAAAPIEEAAEALAPAGESGRLRRSVETSTKLGKRQAGLFRQWTGSQPQMTVDGYRSDPQSAVYVHTGAGTMPYPHMVEFGSAHNVPHPFMRPAWDANKMKALGSIRDDLAEEIEKVRARAARKAAKLAAQMKTA